MTNSSVGFPPFYQIQQMLDRFLAGLAMGIHDKQSDQNILKTAMTTGMLNTMQATTGFVDPAQFQVYFDQVKIQPY